jgi:NADH dehydrogenase
VQTLVHISAIGADANSPSAYARSKAQGETAVRNAFPHAVILRPSIVFGPEDDFFNRFAKMAMISPVLPLIGGGTTRFQPVYVLDVAEAVARAADNPELAGKTFELGGPRIYSFRELMSLLLSELGRRRMLLPLPFAIASLQGAILQAIPFIRPPLTADQVRLLKRDNVVGAQAQGFKELGITPTAVEPILPTYLDLYRPHGYYSRARIG